LLKPRKALLPLGFVIRYFFRQPDSKLVDVFGCGGTVVEAPSQPVAGTPIYSKTCFSYPRSTFSEKGVGNGYTVLPHDSGW
jgi:hypothetical protein